MSESANSPRKLTAKVKQRKALELRKGGLSYQRIAETPQDRAHPPGDPDYAPLYRDKGAAYKAVQKALAEVQGQAEETAHEVLALELARLDEMHAAVWVQAITRNPTNPEGTERAIQTVLKLQERRTRYQGLDFADGLDERYLAVQEHEARRATEAFEAALADRGMTPDEIEEVMARAAHHLDAPSGTGPERGEQA